MEMNEKIRKQQRIKVLIAFAVTFILIAIYLWDFGAIAIRIEENRGKQNLEELAMQGAVIARNKLDAAITTLRVTAKSLEGEEDIQSDEVMRYLQGVVDEGADIIRIGCVDLDGNARITDGRTMNLKHKSFFLEAASGKEYVSSLVSNSKGKDSVAVSVPVYDREGKIVNVIYGVIVTEEFHLYGDSEDGIGDRDQYIHIIDREGNFVFKTKSNRNIPEKNNIFEELEELESDISVGEIRQEIARQGTVSVRLKYADQSEYAYFAPINLNQWYVVAVLDGGQIEAGVGNLRSAVALLVLKVLITLCLFGAFCYQLLIKEKNRIEKLNEELIIKDKTFHMAVAKTGDFMFLYDPQTKVLEFMNYNEQILGVPRTVEDFPDVFPKYIEDLQSQEEVRRLLDSIESGIREAECEVSIKRNEMETIYRVRYTTAENTMNRILRVVGSIENITKEKLQEIRLKKGEQIRAAMLSDVAGFYEINLSKDGLLLNGVLKDSGYTYSEALEHYILQRIQENDRERVKETFSVNGLLDMFRSGVYDSVIQYVRLDENGEESWVESEVHLEEDVESKDVIALVFVRNINDVKLKEMKLTAQATQDPLTKIYNRSSGIERIKSILAQRKEGYGALILIDIDDFKSVNDTMGHTIGDLVLMDVARIISNHVYDRDVVCRLGGDEFLVFLVDIPRETIGRNAAKLVEKLNLSYEKGGMAKKISASMGIAVVPEHGTDFQTLYEKADIALYKVKNSTKNDFRFYE